MSDLISRQAAIDALEDAKKIYIDRKVIIAKMQDIINNLPSAQPEIIRCKDCKWFEEINQPFTQMFCRKHYIDILNDDFCSYAERRTDEQ